MKLRLVILLVITSFSAPAWAASDCLNDEGVKKSAELWGHDPEQALAFGKKIQAAVRENDLQEFASLIHSDLSQGPDRTRFETDKWSDLFGDKLLSIVSDPVPCKSVGYRGFMLSSGLIWYQYNGDGVDDPEGFWEIWAIADWIEEPVSTTSSSDFPSWVANIDEIISGTWTISEFRPAGVYSGGVEETANQLIGKTIKVEDDGISLPESHH